ncbi:hypothetical protein I6H07_22495 [Hafnia alvei]|uniref:hypothetical protein n=1 Tax=Hafnia alvei TaxID=569 RepID=UPI000B624480|nr:hypothetical protein [Hafnia alvei]MBI0277291.1 hypothetical protein [Hafnia alvei]MBI0278512.1 hypothetical protein [Hafnia alvei]PNK96244.1 hypothetical protein CEQ28_000845 [Hafnia alvei]PNK97578.1 hypothetical protein CEQ28_008230 [Hafnia alvei]
MTREDCLFIVHSLIPAIEAEGLTIKTRRAGELTLAPTDPSTIRFVEHLRRRYTEAANAPAMPFIAY